MDGGAISGSTALSMLGALGGAASSGNSTQTVNRDPWAPAQPYIRANIDSSSKLQNFYQQNPLSALQKTAYNNAFADNNSARQGINSLVQQLGNNRGWSRNSGSVLPTGYAFGQMGNQQPGGGSKGGAISDSGLPNNPFSGGGVIPTQSNDNSAALQALLDKFPARLAEAIKTSNIAPTSSIWTTNPQYAMSNAGTRNPYYPADTTANPGLINYNPNPTGALIFDKGA